MTTRREGMAELRRQGRGQGARDLLLAAGEALKPAREVRYLDDDAFDDVSDDELGAGARSLYALSYSCQEGAKKLERIRKARAAEPGT